MNTIRITKEFYFEMAHALLGHDGPCKNIHGHSYNLSVCIIGKIIDRENDPKNGMLLDFSDLKAIVKSQIIDKFDHSLVLNANSPHRDMVKLNSGNNQEEKIILVNYQPTCENLLIDFVKKIVAQLPKTAKLHHLRLKETATSFAEWHADDNVL